MKFNKILLATLVVAVAATSALAQDKKKLSADEQSMYVISAKAGVVNIIEGDVSIKNDAEWNKLIAGDDIKDGAAIRTSSTGRVEILLNPGCFLRLARDSEFVYGEATMSGLKLNLEKGSIMIEAAALDSPITVKVAKSNIVIVREGLYRFNVTPAGQAEVAVRKGRVMIGNTLVKEGKKAVVENDTPVVAKFDKKLGDDFDDWSKDRAKSLIAINNRLSQKAMRRNGLLTSIFSAWVYDPTCGCRTWLPGSYGFSSPYGGSYSRCNPYWYNYDPFYSGYYRRGYNNGNSSGNSGGGMSSGGGGQSGGGRTSPGGGLGPKAPDHAIQPRIQPPSRSESSGGGAPRRQKGINDQ